MSDEVFMPMDDSEFNNTVARSREASSLSAVALAVSDLIEQGCVVSRVIGKAKYDLVVDMGYSKLFKIQVKPAVKRSLQARIGWTVHRETDYGIESRRTRQTYSHEFDYLAIVDRVEKEVYYVPVEDLDLTKDTFTVKLGDKLKYRNL